MAPQLLAVFASASLVTAGAGGVSSTRATDSFPVQHFGLTTAAGKGSVSCLAGSLHGKPSKLVVAGQRTVSGKCASSLAQGQGTAGAGAGSAGAAGAGAGAAGAGVGATGAIVGGVAAAGLAVGIGVAVSNSSTG